MMEANMKKSGIGGIGIVKLSDISNGPAWVMWIVVVVLAVGSVILISGHGSWLISGYNTASKKEKAKYDEKKLCRTTGIGMGIITILIFITSLLKDVLPSNFVYIAAGIILIDALLIIIVGNTVCKKS